MRYLLLLMVACIYFACKTENQSNPSSEKENSNAYSDVQIVGAMKNVMWKGELGANILLDTISDKEGLYGLGPLSFLAGELLINDGKSYASRVISDSSMVVEKSFDYGAPFFVYANVSQWNEIDIPSNIKSIVELEQFVDSRTSQYKRPFVFKLVGTVSSALIHVQNLPEGAKVSSPEEAHRGQVKYKIQDEDVEIIGFFSTEHQGIFTHHDTFLHMHLITEDKRMMGHLDELVIEQMKLFLPVN